MEFVYAIWDGKGDIIMICDLQLVNINPFISMRLYSYLFIQMFCFD